MPLAPPNSYPVLDKHLVEFGYGKGEGVGWRYSP